MGRSLRDMWRDRQRKQGWYDTPEYWDMKATVYAGLARSNWPSNAYNAHVHARQMATIDELLGDVKGLRIAEVGCGTGRVCVHLAKRGATCIGWDFAPKTVEAARRHAEEEGASASFHVGDVLSPLRGELESFDVVMTLGCLTLACKNADDFETALDNLQALGQPDARYLFLEPIHQSRLLRRILRMGMSEWIDRCELRGMSLVQRGGVCFVPSRIALAYRELPRWLVEPVFGAGEQVLDLHPALEPLADYKYLLFQ